MAISPRFSHWNVHGFIHFLKKYRAVEQGMEGVQNEKQLLTYFYSHWI